MNLWKVCVHCHVPGADDDSPWIVEALVVAPTAERGIELVNESIRKNGLNTYEGKNLGKKLTVSLRSIEYDGAVSLVDGKPLTVLEAKC